MNNSFLINNRPTSLQMIFQVVMFPLFAIIFADFVPQFLRYKIMTPWDYLMIAFITLILFFVAIKYTMHVIKAILYFLIDRKNPPITKSTEIKNKNTVRSKGGANYYIKDKEGTNYEVSPEIYNYFDKGERVIINYYSFSKYLHSIAKDNSNYIDSQNNELIKYT